MAGFGLWKQGEDAITTAQPKILVYRDRQSKREHDEQGATTADRAQTCSPITYFHQLFDWIFEWNSPRRQIMTHGLMNGMEWNGWNGMEWMEWNGMDGLDRNGNEGMEEEWSDGGMEWREEWFWNGMDGSKEGMEWNGLEWNGSDLTRWKWRTDGIDRRISSDMIHDINNQRPPPYELI